MSERAGCSNFDTTLVQTRAAPTALPGRACNKKDREVDFFPLAPSICFAVMHGSDTWAPHPCAFWFYSLSLSPPAHANLR
jgi:hypothetical protein